MKLFKRKKLYIALFLVLSVIVCSCFILFGEVYRPEHVTGILETEEATFLAVESTNYYEIVKLSGNTKKAGIIIDKYFEGLNRVYLEKIYEDEGTLYLQLRTNASALECTEIYRMDFEKEECILECSFFNDEIWSRVFESAGLSKYMMINTFCRYIDGNLHIYCCMIDTENEEKEYIYDIVSDTEHNYKIEKVYDVGIEGKYLYLAGAFKNAVFMYDTYGRHYLFDFKMKSPVVIYGSDRFCQVESKNPEYLGIDKQKEVFTGYTLSGDELVSFDYGLPVEEYFLNNKNYDISEIRYMATKQNSISFVCSHNQKPVIIRMDADGSVVERTWWFKDTVFVILVKCLLLIGLIAAIELILIAFYHYVFKKGAILLKLTAMLLPVVLCLVVFVYVATGLWYVSMSKKKYGDVLIQQGKQLEAFQLMDSEREFDFAFDRYDNTKDDMFSQTVEKVNYDLDVIAWIMGITDMLLGLSQTEIQFQMEVDYIVVLDDKFYDIFITDWTTDIETFWGEEEAAVFKNVVEKKEPVTYEGWLLGRTESYYGFVPELSESGEVQGIFCVSVQTKTIMDDVNEFLDKFIKYEILYMVVVMAAFYIIAIICIHPFVRLRKNVQKIMNGNNDVKLKKHLLWYDESDIVSLLLENLLAESYKNLEELDRLIQADEIFFDVNKLKLVNRKNIGQLTFNEHVVGEYFITNIYLSDKYLAIDALEGLFQEINPILSATKTSIFSTDDRLVWQAISKSEKAVDLAIALLSYDATIRLLFDRSLVRVSVEGTGENYRFCMEYEDVNRVESIREQILGMNVGFAISENALLCQKKKLVYNCIAIYNGEFFYEVYDSSHSLEKRLSEKRMKQSVIYFAQGRYQEARCGFIKELKEWPHNSVALYYVRKIDAISD